MYQPKDVSWTHPLLEVCPHDIMGIYSPYLMVRKGYRTLHRHVDRILKYRWVHDIKDIVWSCVYCHIHWSSDGWGLEFQSFKNSQNTLSVWDIPKNSACRVSFHQMQDRTYCNTGMSCSDLWTLPLICLLVSSYRPLLKVPWDQYWLLW